LAIGALSSSNDRSPSLPSATAEKFTTERKASWTFDWKWPARARSKALAAKAQEADEDFGTARLIARARKEIAAGMLLIPKEVVDRIVRGENALRALREWRGKTQLYIAHKTNIGQGYISDLESGRRKGTTKALKKIADVLKLPLDLIA
jgi:ribosome-binding protein aMBF1 (putative translation factor)